jgi:hypothetical protein
MSKPLKITIERSPVNLMDEMQDNSSEIKSGFPYSLFNKSIDEVFCLIK